MSPILYTSMKFYTTARMLLYYVGILFSIVLINKSEAQTTQSVSEISVLTTVAMKDLRKAVQHSISTSAIWAAFLNPFPMRNNATVPAQKTTVRTAPLNSVGYGFELMPSTVNESVTWRGRRTRSSARWSASDRRKNSPECTYPRSYSSFYSV